MNDPLILAPAIPEIFLACAAMALLMLGVFRGDSSTRLVVWLSVASLAVAAFLALAAPSGRSLAFGGLFVVDSFAVFMKVLVLLGAALSLLCVLDWNEREQPAARFEFPVLVLLGTLGMLMMISANDLVALYVGFELQSLPLYVLAAFRRDTVRSTEAGLKYFVLGALSSGMLLYGASLVYGFGGTTNFEALGAIFAQGGGDVAIGVIVGIVFICAGLAFKISAAPFHMWTPDVYEGAPTPVTTFFAVAPKLAAVALFVRVLVEPFGPLVGQWQQVIWFVSVASMLIGGFGAIAQPNIKRLMGYSSISNIGYALIGLAAGTEEGVRGVLIYMAIYLFMTLGTFAVILCMRRRGQMVEQLTDLSGLSKTHPMMAAAMAAFMFSLAGIPPLAGFFGKLYVFIAAIEADLIALAVIGVLTSVVSCYYYIRIVKLMYFDDVTEPLDRPIGRETGAVLALSGIVIVLFFVFPMPILAAASEAAAALFAG